MSAPGNGGNGGNGHARRAEKLASSPDLVVAQRFVVLALPVVFAIVGYLYVAEKSAREDKIEAAELASAGAIKELHDDQKELRDDQKAQAAIQNTTAIVLERVVATLEAVQKKNEEQDEHLRATDKKVEELRDRLPPRRWRGPWNDDGGDER